MPSSAAGIDPRTARSPTSSSSKTGSKLFCSHHGRFGSTSSGTAASCVGGDPSLPQPASHVGSSAPVARTLAPRKKARRFTAGSSDSRYCFSHRSRAKRRVDILIAIHESTMLRQAKRRPIRLPRALARLPLLVDRLGWHAVNGMATRVLGVEWIVLNTRGRRSGRPHTVMLDVVGYDAPRDIYYVQPAEGRRSDWVRNVTADPHMTAHVRTRHVRAVVRDATGPEGAEVVLCFLRAHPWYGRIIVWFVGYVDRIDRPDEEQRRDIESTQVFAIEVAD